MKRASFLFCFVLIASAGPVQSAPLDQKSKAPDWGRATQAEKDAWIAAFKFKQADVKKADVAACLDKHAGKPLFETNDLSGVTEMCGTIAALP
ncbi:hypothetical protein [Hyphomicrobium sp.]|uniref:hypothetical protein n=1 Tax=Hyphomicrobium sp. TaxID=82 RepID=UPI002E311B3F|nr:hypothetical protein [Hyphomicrobium sp.]HEX2843193.1 hypothetical protein [Hyphomicrobium sp.]